MNKRIIILFIGAILLFVIFVAVIFLQQNQNQGLPNPSSLQSQNPANLQPTQNNAIPQVTLVPLASDPKAAVKQFYTYYFSSPQNPLANGAFKNNPYLSDDFKISLESIYNNGNAPIFCPQNKRADIYVGDETQVYYNNEYLTQEAINEASASGKELYRVTMENKGGKWLVDDITCSY